MIIHAFDVTADGATHLSIHSLETDVLVLAIRRYPEICGNSTSFVTGKGGNHRAIKLHPIVEALGPTKTAALSAFHELGFDRHFTGR